MEGEFNKKKARDTDRDVEIHKVQGEKGKREERGELEITMYMLIFICFVL